MNAIVWPPIYQSVFATRQKRLRNLRENQVLLKGAFEYYRTHPVEFIEHWCVTYDPRNAGTDLPTKLPFVLFKRQREFIEYLHALVSQQENGLVEKARDMGATWLCAAFSIWLWIFWDGASIGWGSRKENLVDTIGDPDSIFEKMRMIIRWMPKEFIPEGFKEKDHMTFMKIVNPKTEATITGESGDNIGRGGRKLCYFKDEAQPLDAKILTPDGWRTMGDMRVGSSIIGLDGKAHNVIGINDCGEHQTYRITFSDGTSTKCSSNHLWTVEDVWHKRETKILRANEIAAKFFYRSPAGQTQFFYRVPVCSPVEFRKNDEQFPLDPYLVGALLGDGSVGDVPNHSPKITSIDSEIIEQFELLLPEGCIITKEKDRVTWRLGDELGRRGWKWKSRARQAVVEAGIAGMRSHDKCVPERYLFASPEARLALLQGLMDTDGSAANGGSASFHTSSPKLAEDVRFLVQSLGGTATIDIKEDKRGFKSQYVLHLMTRNDVNLFRLTRKINAHKQRKHPPGRTIVAVELCEKEIVRCISIDNEDGLYLTDHMIVTHNSAHYMRPEKIEAALADTTNVQVDISSVNGIGNVFHRKREAGVEWQPGEVLEKRKTNVFVMEWSDHPAKNQEWYDDRRQEAENNGLLHLFAQEVDRDYSAALIGVIIPKIWVDAAVDAHLKLGIEDHGSWFAALDVADGGNDRNALAKRKSIILRELGEWNAPDTGITARRAVNECSEFGPIDLQYDCIGVGAGVKAETNRLVREKLMPKTVRLIAWNASASVLWPEKNVEEHDRQSPKNEDFYENLKAQAWWLLRRRFEKTYRAIHEGIKYNISELISLDSTIPLLRTLKKELSQPTITKSISTGRLVVDKTPEGTKSPNVADAVVMCYHPVPDGSMPFISQEMIKRTRRMG